MDAELWEGATAEEYRADPSINQSGIKLFLADPQDYFQRCVAKTLPPKPETKAQRFGKDVEAFAFYERLPVVMIPQHVLQQRTVAGKVQYARAGAAWTHWEAQQVLQHGPDVKLLKAEEFEAEVTPIIQAVASIRAHATARDLVFGETVKHVRIRWTDEITGMRCKCEIDLVHARGVFPDLKTGADVSPAGFTRSVLNFGYNIQANMYRTAMRELAADLGRVPDSELGRFLLPILKRIRDGEDPLASWVAVKSKPSYHCEVYPVESDWYSVAETVTRQAMQEIAAARRSGRWQTRTFGGVGKLPMPAYAWQILEHMTLED